MAELMTADSNEVLDLSFVRADAESDSLDEESRVSIEEFNPKFTYPIFGEAEKIYGYEDLAIKLKFASGSLVQYLNIQYSKKVKGNTADDIEGTLYKFIPPDYYKNEKEFLARVEQDATAFKPLGKKIYSYARLPGGRGKGKQKANAMAVDENAEDAIVYEAYFTTWDTPGFKEYHRRMQLFVLLHIEGGSYIQEDEDRWEFVVLFERRRRADGMFSYHFVGYSSLYQFYCWPDKIRLRLSQFVIAGPYQSKGHGSTLYRAIYEYALARPEVAELTIEDPSEAFEDLRDKVDLRMLIAHPKFLKEGYGESFDAATLQPHALGKLGPPTSREWSEKWRIELKMAGRQFSRLVEMLLLRKLPPNEVKLSRAYRLQVKERVFRFNYEIMSQLDKQERVEKLDETFQSVKDDYLRILALV